MSTGRFARGTAARRAFSGRELLVLSVVVVLILAVLPTQLAQMRVSAMRATCADNLHLLGQAMHIYANDNWEWFPIHYFAGRNMGPMDEPTQHPMYWVGMMGSTDELLISEPTSPHVSPYASHPSRSLFLLLTGFTQYHWLTPEHFVCPDSGERPDDLWNYGPDGDVPGVPGVNRFDFRGYNHLSYGYQMPFGRRGMPRETLPASMPLMADKSPYYEGYWPAQGPAHSVHDQRSALYPPQHWAHMPVEEILELTTEWQPYNSPNHGGPGQNVMLVDGSVFFAETPIVGVNADNIYTLWSSQVDPHGSLIGVMPDAEDPWGPAAQTDSFLVP